jgi:ERCC4-type nuclease
MTPFEIKHTLESMVVLVDTREQDTPALHRRLEGLSCPFEREKLESGDYSCRFILPDGTAHRLNVAVERKMSLDELCSCFTRGRPCFAREFYRAKLAGMKLHLLIECGSWDHALSGKYRSRFSPEALSASMLAWSARFQSGIFFCKPENTGKLIFKILRYELKEQLEGGKFDNA